MTLGIGTGLGKGGLHNGLPTALKAKFLFLWTGKFSGDNLKNDLDATVITVTGKDFTSRFIPGDSEATFAVPDNATYIAADGADDLWFNVADVLQQLAVADLIAGSTARTFVKYSDFEPYDIRAIGILKTASTLTEADQLVLTKYFKLWTQYFGYTMFETGYMKDNRILLEDPS